MIEINGKNLLYEGKHVDRSHDVVENNDKYTLYQVYSAPFFFALRARVGRRMEEPLPEIPAIAEILKNPEETLFVVVIRGEIHLPEANRFLWATIDRTGHVLRNRNMMNVIVGNAAEKGSKWDTLTGQHDFYSHLVWKTPPQHERAEAARAKAREKEEKDAAKRQADEDAKKAHQLAGKEKIKALIKFEGSLDKIQRALRSYRYDNNLEVFLADIIENNRLDLLPLVSKVSVVAFVAQPTVSDQGTAILGYSLIPSVEMFKALEALGMEWREHIATLFPLLSQKTDIASYILANLGEGLMPFIKNFLCQAPVDNEEALKRLKQLEAAGWVLPSEAQQVSQFLNQLAPWTKPFLTDVVLYYFSAIIDKGADVNMKVNLGSHEYPLWLFGVEKPLLDAKKSTITNIKNQSLAFLRMLLDHGLDPNTELHTGSKLLGQLLENCRVFPAEMVKFVYDLKYKYGYRFGEKHDGKNLSKILDEKAGAQVDKLRAFIVRQERLETGTSLTLDNELEEKRKRQRRF